MKRYIDLLVIHCSATPEGRDYTVADITRWHRERGFQTIGYHYVIYRDGTLCPGRPEECIGAHVTNHNRNSIGICYIGGLDAFGHPKDTRTTAQKRMLHELLVELKKCYPHAKIQGHHDLNPQKACPCFPAAAEYSGL